MSPIERLRWATAPVLERSTALLWSGLALFVASDGIPVLYLRSLYGQATAEMRRVHSKRMQDE